MNPEPYLDATLSNTVVTFMQPAVIVIVDPLDCVPALSQLALQRVRENFNAGVCSLSIMQRLVRPNDKPPLIRGVWESTA